MLLFFLHLTSLRYQDQHCKKSAAKGIRRGHCGLTSSQSQLQRIRQRFSYYGARNAAVTFIAMLRYHRAGTVLSAFGRDVIVYIIGPLLYETRSDVAWHNVDGTGYSRHVASFTNLRDRVENLELNRPVLYD